MANEITVQAYVTPEEDYGRAMWFSPRVKFSREWVWLQNDDFDMLSSEVLSEMLHELEILPDESDSTDHRPLKEYFRNKITLFKIKADGVSGFLGFNTEDGYAELMQAENNFDRLAIFERFTRVVVQDTVSLDVSDRVNILNTTFLRMREHWDILESIVPSPYTGLILINFLSQIEEIEGGRNIAAGIIHREQRDITTLLEDVIESVLVVVQVDPIELSNRARLLLKIESFLAHELWANQLRQVITLRLEQLGVASPFAELFKLEKFISKGSVLVPENTKLQGYIKNLVNSLVESSYLAEDIDLLLNKYANGNKDLLFIFYINRDMAFLDLNKPHRNRSFPYLLTKVENSVNHLWIPFIDSLSMPNAVDVDNKATYIACLLVKYASFISSEELIKLVETKLLPLITNPQHKLLAMDRALAINEEVYRHDLRSLWNKRNHEASDKLRFRYSQAYYLPQSGNQPLFLDDLDNLGGANSKGKGYIRDLRVAIANIVQTAKVIFPEDIDVVVSYIKEYLHDMQVVIKHELTTNGLEFGFSRIYLDFIYLVATVDDARAARMLGTFTPFSTAIKVDVEAAITVMQSELKNGDVLLAQGSKYRPYSIKLGEAYEYAKTLSEELLLLKVDLGIEPPKWLLDGLKTLEQLMSANYGQIVLYQARKAYEATHDAEIAIVDTVVGQTDIIQKRFDAGLITEHERAILLAELHKLDSADISLFTPEIIGGEFDSHTTIEDISDILNAEITELEVQATWLLARPGVYRFKLLAPRSDVEIEIAVEAVNFKRHQGDNEVLVLRDWESMLRSRIATIYVNNEVVDAAKYLPEKIKTGEIVDLLLSLPDTEAELMNPASLEHRYATVLKLLQMWPTLGLYNGEMESFLSTFAREYLPMDNKEVSICFTFGRRLERVLLDLQNAISLQIVTEIETYPNPCVDEVKTRLNRVLNLLEQADSLYLGSRSAQNVEWIERLLGYVRNHSGLNGKVPASLNDLYDILKTYQEQVLVAEYD